MRIATGFAGALLTLGAMTAQATSYGLDLTISSWDFDGTFDFSKSGNCAASSLLCPTASTPDFSHVLVSNGFNQGYFTQANLTKSGSKEHVVLYDLNGEAGLSSQAIQLVFDINAPLGGRQTTFKLNDIQLNVNNNSTGQFRCGGQIKCTSSLTAAVAAPELDVTSSGGVVALLLGSLAVMQGRRQRARNR